MVNVAYVHGQKYLHVGDGQYGVVEVGNMDVVRLGNSKVAASWTRIFFGMNTWLGSVALGSQLFQFFAPCFFLIGSWHVGSSGGHRRAVTAGHRSGPGGD